MIEKKVVYSKYLFFCACGKPLTTDWERGNKECEACYWREKKIDLKIEAELEKRWKNQNEEKKKKALLEAKNG